jgi:hypothetical protein
VHKRLLCRLLQHFNISAISRLVYFSFFAISVSVIDCASKEATHFFIGLVCGIVNVVVGIITLNSRPLLHYRSSCDNYIRMYYYRMTYDLLRCMQVINEVCYYMSNLLFKPFNFGIYASALIAKRGRFI